MKAKQHQSKAIDFALDALKNHRRCVAQLPTGSGKTLVGLTVASMMGNRRVWILTPTVESLAAHTSQARHLGIACSVELAERKASRFARLCLTTYATAWHRPQAIKPDDLLIFDECHHVNFKAPINAALVHEKRLAFGLSASPWSVGCKSFFPNRHIQPLSELIELGINARYEICEWTDPVNRGYQIVYSRASQNHSLLKGLKQSDYAICSRENSRQVIDRFRRGLVRTIIVNRMLTEGFDLRQVKSVFIDRRIRSKIMLYQMAGRALRPHNGETARIYVQDSDTKDRLLLAFKRAR